MLDKQFIVLYYEITTVTYCQLTTWFPLSEDFKKTALQWSSFNSWGTIDLKRIGLKCVI